MMASQEAPPRHEVKLLVNYAELADVELWLRLHPAGFRSTYPQRQVNNIYFDTLDLASVDANFAGVSERYKLRLRWYGAATDIVQGVWELKSKRGGVGWKQGDPLDRTVPLDAVTWAQALATLRGSVPISLRGYLATACWPVLINCYQRKYFASFDGAIRATVDFAQAFYDQRLSGRPNLTRVLPSPDEIVLEFKTSPEHHDRLVATVQRFPARVATNSKYVNGVLYAQAADPLAGFPRRRSGRG